MTDPTVVKWLVFCALGAGVALTAVVLLLTGRGHEGPVTRYRELRRQRRRRATRSRNAAQMRRRRMDTEGVAEELNEAFPPKR